MHSRHMSPLKDGFHIGCMTMGEMVLLLILMGLSQDVTGSELRTN